MSNRATLVRTPGSVALAIRDASPIMMAYFPIAITFGVLATSAGLHWLPTVLVSVIIYAGGAQFMFITLAADASPTATIVTLLLVNARHILYGTTLGPAFAAWSEPRKWLYAFGLTDEVFTMSSQRVLREEPSPAHQYIFVFACYLSWVAGTVVGASVGHAFPTSVTNILAFALPALFLALLLLGEKSRAHMLAAVTGAAVAIAATLTQLSSIGIVAGAVLGATMGLAANELWKSNTISSNKSFR